MFNFNRNNMRCKKLHWMTETVWSWHIVFTDHMSDLLPRFTKFINYASQTTTAANRRSACSQIHMPNDQL